MPIVSDPSLISYICIAEGTAIVAEFNRYQSSDLACLARKCIDAAPQHHSVFSQTYRQKTYTFLIDDPYIYFAVTDSGLDKSEGLQFLNGVKIGFCEQIKSGSVKNSNSDHLGIQTHFDFILRGLLFDSESAKSPKSIESAAGSRNPSLDSTNGIPSTPLLKKKKNSHGDGNLENRVVDVVSGSDRYVEKIPFSTDRQKSKLWKKQVWVVLLLDLFVCAVLFGVWLWVCSGFQCIAS